MNAILDIIINSLKARIVIAEKYSNKNEIAMCHEQIRVLQESKTKKTKKTKKTEYKTDEYGSACE